LKSTNPAVVAIATTHSLLSVCRRSLPTISHSFIEPHSYATQVELHISRNTEIDAVQESCGRPQRGPLILKESHAIESKGEGRYLVVKAGARDERSKTVYSISKEEEEEALADELDIEESEDYMSPVGRCT
jgi:hypothetical protein